MKRSVWLIWAFWAARCAMRSLFTRCSGVSPGIREGFGAVAATEGEGLAAAAAEPAVLDVACGIVEVNLVASLTVRGPILEAIVVVRFDVFGGSVLRKWEE